MPSDRRPFVLKFLRWMLRPDLFPEVLERVNISHCAQKAALLEMTKKLRLSYPMLSYFNLSIDHRDNKSYSLNKLESELKLCYY